MDRHFAAVCQFEAGNLYTLQEYDIFASAQRQVVRDAYRGQNISQFRGELAAYAGDPAQQRRVLSALHKLHQTESHFDGKRFHLQQALQVLARWRGRRGGLFRRDILLAQPPTRGPHAGAKQQKRYLGKSGEGRHGDEHTRGQQQGLRTAENLLAEILPQPGFGTGAGNDQPARDGDHQRRNYCNQPVADGEDRVGLDGSFELHAVLQNSDEEAGDNVDRGNENGRPRIALSESGCAVHGAVELRFRRELFPPRPRPGFVDETGIEVRIDGHLFSGQRVQGETRRNFRDTHRTVVDDHVLDGNQDQENDNANDIVDPAHEGAECLYHFPRRTRSRVSVEQIGRAS